MMEFIAVTSLLVLMNVSLIDVATEPAIDDEQRSRGTIIIETVPAPALWSSADIPAPGTVHSTTSPNS